MASLYKRFFAATWRCRTNVAVCLILLVPLLIFVVFAPWYKARHTATRLTILQNELPPSSAIAAAIEPIVSDPSTPLMRENISLNGGGVRSGMPDLEMGKWIVLDRPKYQVSHENTEIKNGMIATNGSELRYVLVVDPQKRVSVGHYRFMGSSGSTERFISEYTIYLCDWKRKNLVWKEVLRSPANPGNIGLIGSWDENQSKPRRTILHWMSAFDLVVPGWSF